MLNTDFTITEIADYLGFYDTSYFYRMFRKMTSMSPTAFVAQQDPGNHHFFIRQL
ncbi:helix-turn-helix domain-containing protein [Paenibacillus hemerocallicola]|uniref:helix-turn-helix domain-containing protein n=1 Tax=Paenibacillus hemerocallicola TaxID=1172614 RepID=UPI001FE303A0|nr:AraC family transcriptional regulator [Paenibacillus hemerocallicola]